MDTSLEVVSCTLIMSFFMEKFPVKPLEKKIAAGMSLLYRQAGGVIFF